MKLYIIKAFNSFGGCGGTYHIVATGVNKAKAALRKHETWCKQLEVVQVISNLITAE